MVSPDDKSRLELVARALSNAHAIEEALRFDLRTVPEGDRAKFADLRQASHDLTHHLIAALTRVAAEL
jgi:hypothetical protein